MIKNLQSVLFDLDGTLLDTADDLGAALNYVLAQQQLPLMSAAQYRPVASNGAKGLLELGFGDNLKNYHYEELRQSLLSYYQNNIATHTSLYDGMSELLTYLNNNNITWGVVTNKPEDLTLALLPHYPEFQNCAVVVGGDTLAKRKPDPEPILFALEKIQCAAEQCIYVGDAPRDIEAGKSANTATVAASWGYIKSPDECQQWQADFISATPNALQQLFISLIQ